jgi:lysophospholipase L1-like esterase
MRTKNRAIGILVMLAALLSSVPPVSQAGPRADHQVRTFSPTLAAAPGGMIWAAWVADYGDDWEIMASRGDGRTWEPAQVVWIDAGRWDMSPSLALDADGVAWLAWSSSSGTDDTLHVSHWTGKGWSTPLPVPAGDTIPNREPVLAPTADGGLWLAWVGFDGNDDEIYAALWNGSTWSDPQRVSGDDADPAAYDTQPRLAVGPDGTVWAAWTGHEKLLDTEIFCSRWDGQHWTVEQKVSIDDDTTNAYPSLAVAGDGKVWLAWHGWTAEAPDVGRRISVASWSEEEGWNDPTIVSSPLTSEVSDERPILVLDAGGRPLVSWNVDDGRLGVGYTAFDGARWSAPRWAVQNAVTDSAFVAHGDLPLLFWWPEGASISLSSSQRLPDDTVPLLPVVEAPARPQEVEDVIINRHVAFGDSITLGAYDDPLGSGNPVGPYAGRLDEKLDTRVVASEVLNLGVSGERTLWGLRRLEWDVLPDYRPQFVEIMEGTNDITVLKPLEDIASNLEWMLRHCKNAGSICLLGTVIPRRDSLNDETFHLNEYIRAVAANRNAPLVDHWQRFYDYGNWQSLYVDTLHPNRPGMILFAQSWYDGIITNISWLNEETEPPTTWIASLPIQTTCGQAAVVSWAGADNLSWVTEYDVQRRLNYGAWTDWLLATQDTNGSYTGTSYGDVIGFRVRGRDVVGNQNDYSAAAYSTVVDVDPPYQVGVRALPPAQKPPFEVRWYGVDACSLVTAYDVQYRVGLAAVWQSWLSGTPDASAIFDPTSPQYGQTYYFRVRARDQAGKWSDWSASVSTVLARFTVNGQVVTIRHEPVAQAQVAVAGALLVETEPLGRYAAYLADAGSYDLSASRDGFAVLPAMQGQSVTTDMSGLDFVLPPLDDVVGDGGFETGSWGDWEPGGTLSPTLTAPAHTGDGAVLLGGPEDTATLSQSFSVPGTLTDATLSFLVRLHNDADVSSTLQIELGGTSLSHTQLIVAGGWTHVWFPVEEAVGQVVTLGFTISGSPAVRLDEVSLGSAAKGGYWVYLPLTVRAAVP